MTARSRSRLGRLLALFVVAITATACTSSHPKPTTSESVPPEERTPLPTIVGTGLNQERIDLAESRGRVVVLSVWGSWCVPCREEADDLERVHRETEAEGVTFIGLDTHDLDVDVSKRFVREHGVTFPSIFDPEGGLVRAFPPGTLNPQTLPATLLIDRAGRIAVRLLRPVTDAELRSALDPVVAEQP